MNSIWIIYWWLLLHVSSFAGGSDLYEVPQDTKKLKTGRETIGYHSVKQQRCSRGLGGVGSLQTPGLHNSQIHEAGTGGNIPTKSPFPPLISRSWIFYAKQVLQGGKKVTRDEEREWRAHGQEVHPSSWAGPWSSTNPHCNRGQQQLQHPFTSSLHSLAHT